MSLDSATAFVGGRPSNIDKANRILSDHIILVFAEYVGVVAIYKIYDIADGAAISIPFGRAVKLLDAEKVAIKGIGTTNSLQDYLPEIFAERFKKSNVDPDEFYDWLEESVPYVSTLDLLSSVLDGEITVSGTIVASRGIFFGNLVQFPDSGVEIIQKFITIQDDEGLRLKEVAHSVSVELGECSWSGHCQFDFERIESLFSGLIDEVDATTHIRISRVSVKTPSDDYIYELQVGGIQKTLSVNFKYKGPENIRLRAEKHFRLHACVKEDGHELWSGFDSVELKVYLNQWCKTNLQNCLDQMGFPPVSISGEQMERWALEIANVEKQLPDEEHPNYPNELIKVARPLAENGNALAQCAIGVVYLDREDGGRDMDKAIEWLQSSARNGFAAAARNLQKVFSLGLGGVVDDPDAGKKWAAFAKALDAM